ncbi:MAG: hypothetical protein KDH20_17345 [Rhodocyclaceae bacterium]|nr:hypothetical protein [Rhodocyclaceae bacterium]
MPDTVTPHRIAPALCLAAVLGAPLPALADGHSADALKARVADLERELAEARAALEAAKSESAPATPSRDIAFDIGGGTLKVGGASRVNYAVGDYGDDTGGPSRAQGDGGNFTLDTFRINLDYNNGPLLGKLEYRFYNGSHFLHTGWVGYQLDEASQIQVGVNRVPFGPGAYGVSQSWFFDQHYYVGLADDMDLGAKYTRSMGNLTFDAAVYFSDEGTGAGRSKDSARYSYDVVDETGSGYDEGPQINLRAIYSLPGDGVKTDVGASFEYGRLESQGSADDGSHWAASAHMVNKWAGFTLATQLTRYEYDVDAAQPLGTDTLVQVGAFDFPNTIAAKAWIPAVSLSYTVNTPGVGWLDYIVPYAEYSRIMKDEDGFNDSDLLTFGAAWANGGWYIYTDLVFSNGNEFVGGEAAFGDRLGANADDEWQKRFNVNFGYYF